MNFNEENIARFDQYLENEMPGDERAEFEKELLENSELKGQFEAYEGFILNLTQAEITDFTKKLTVWDREERNAAPKKARTQIYSLRFIAAAAVLTIGIVLTVNYFFNSPSHEDLVATYFEPYDNVITVRGEKEELDDALLKYEEKNYAEALVIFATYAENETANFYAGECEMALKDYDKALISFEKTIKAKGLFSEIATFHKALAYVGKGDEVQAKITLISIAEKSDFYEKAQNLLRDLK